jgi:meso-butanediol dehydrogenase/(S,S)-butanediol dehydrogenase/diacetyl reductase
VQPQSRELIGKVALVTGAASGIGKSTADLFSKTGLKVFEIDIKFEGNKLTTTSPDRIRFRADLTSSADVKKAVEELWKTFGRLDVLINSAGIEMSGNVIDLSEESFQRVMDTNVKSIFLVCKYAIPLILKSSDRGSVINISSDLAIQPIPNTDAYAASKGAIVSLTKALSKNWAKQGLRVNCIAPGPIDTPLLHRFQSKEVLNFVKSSLIPAGRLGTPEEVANVALFLASEESSFISGAVITVNGGLLG